MTARRGPDIVNRVLGRLDVATALKNEVSEIENILHTRGDIVNPARRKIQNILTLSRNLKSDTDPDIPLILQAIYQLRGIFNPNFRSTMKPMANMSAAERNAERMELLHQLDAGNLNKEEFDRIVRRTEELRTMMQRDQR